MVNILIRNLDEQVVDRLKRRARERGLSLEAEVRRILGEAAAVTRAEIATRAAWIRAQQRPNRTRAVDLIRKDRER